MQLATVAWVTSWSEYCDSTKKFTPYTHMHDKFLSATAAMNKDAEHMELCVTLDLKNLGTDFVGILCDQRFWDWRELVKFISLRELRASSQVLKGRFGERFWSLTAHHELLNISNTSSHYVNIINSVVYASSKMMKELRNSHRRTRSHSKGRMSAFSHQPVCVRTVATINQACLL